MKALVLAVWSLGCLAPARAATPEGPTPSPKQAPSLLGEVKAQAILASRGGFREGLARVRLTPELRARWKAVRQPFTLVAVFGTWCEDSHRELPSLLALDTEPNPFIEIHYLGVGRKLAVPAWPRGCVPQKVERVPTFYLYALRPGGRLAHVGTLEEGPRPNQTTAEALVDLLEQSARWL